MDNEYKSYLIDNLIHNNSYENYISNSNNTNTYTSENTYNKLLHDFNKYG